MAESRLIDRLGEEARGLANIFYLDLEELKEASMKELAYSAYRNELSEKIRALNKRVFMCRPGSGLKSELPKKFYNYLTCPTGADLKTDYPALLAYYAGIKDKKDNADLKRIKAFFRLIRSDYNSLISLLNVKESKDRSELGCTINPGRLSLSTFPSIILLALVCRYADVFGEYFEERNGKNKGFGKSIGSDKGMVLKLTALSRSEDKDEFIGLDMRIRKIGLQSLAIPFWQLTRYNGIWANLFKSSTWKDTTFEDCDINNQDEFPHLRRMNVRNDDYIPELTNALDKRCELSKLYSLLDQLCNRAQYQKFNFDEDIANNLLMTYGVIYVECLPKIMADLRISLARKYVTNVLSPTLASQALARCAGDPMFRPLPGKKL